MKMNRKGIWEICLERLWPKDSLEFSADWEISAKFLKNMMKLSALAAIKWTISL